MKNKILVSVLAVLLVVSAGLSVFMFAGSNSLENPKSVSTVTTPNQTAASTPAAFASKASTSSVAAAPAGVNLALKKYATSNNYTDVYLPKNAIDGVATGASYWEGKPRSYPDNLNIDLEKSYTVTAFRIKVCPNIVWSARTETFSVNVSNDGNTYTTLVPSATYSFDPASGNLVDIILKSSIKTRYVQFSFTANTQATGGQVAEAEIYGPGN